MAGGREHARDRDPDDLPRHLRAAEETRREPPAAARHHVGEEPLVRALRGVRGELDTQHHDQDAGIRVPRGEHQEQHQLGRDAEDHEWPPAAPRRDEPVARRPGDGLDENRDDRLETGDQRQRRGLDRGRDELLHQAGQHDRGERAPGDRQAEVVGAEGGQRAHARLFRVAEPGSDALVHSRQLYEASLARPSVPGLARRRDGGWGARGRASGGVSAWISAAGAGAPRLPPGAPTSRARRDPAASTRSRSRSRGRGSSTGRCGARVA